MIWSSKVFPMTSACCCTLFSGVVCAFSKMKLIKFYLHSIMCQDWLNSLVMFSTERQLAQELDFKDLIYDFWYKKKQQL